MSAERPPRVSRVRVLARQIRYQNQLLLRSPTATFFTLAVPWMLVATLDVAYGSRTVPGHDGLPFPQFYLPAMMTFAIANACYINVMTGTTVARQAGMLKRIRGTPLPGPVYLAGRIVSAGMLCVISVVGVMVISVTTSDAHVVWGTMPGTVVTAVVGMVCFSTIALALTPLIDNAEAALPVAYGTILPLSFVSEVFFPSGTGPEWLQHVASFLPLQPLAHTLGENFLPGATGTGFSGRALLVMGAWTIAAATALVWFRWNPTRYEAHRRARSAPVDPSVARGRSTSVG